MRKHSKRCEGAKSPEARCKCRCKGELHGITPLSGILLSSAIGYACYEDKRDAPPGAFKVIKQAEGGKG